MGEKRSTKLKMDPEGEQGSGEAEMERLTNHGDGEGLAVEKVNPAVDFVGLGVFPEEIWVLVLDKLAHSQDILSVLKAFPELDKSCHYKKASWLFDQVLPHLMTQHLVIKKEYFHDDYVDSRELLKLRLISKRWKMVVDSSIQYHADFHPINSDKSSAAASVALPVNHFNNNRISKYHMGATVFHTIKDINDFLVEMADFQGNPFPGKHVYFEIDDHANDNCHHFAMRAVELLRKFGQHVLFISWEIREGANSRNHLNYCKAVLKGLSSTPNLQSLRIWSSYLVGSKENLEAANKYFSKGKSVKLFPRLEKLKSCDLEVDVEGFGGMESVWIELLIDIYGGGLREQKGLRKLSLDLKHWDAEMATNLKNLTELQLYFGGMQYFNVGDIGKVLRMFPKGQLKKFGFSDFGRYANCWGVRIYIDELIEMVAEFEIENVAFELTKLEEKSSQVSAPKIRSLHLTDTLGLSYEFLKGLPNLRFLSVYVGSDVVDELDREPERDKDSFAFKVRQYFRNVDKNYEWKGDRNFDIWKECGKLEMLSASVKNKKHEECVFDVRFVREHGNKPFRGWNFSNEAEEDEAEEAE